MGFDALISPVKYVKIDYELPEDKSSGVDWPSYGKAQVNELRDMLLFVRNSVNEAVERLGFDSDSGKDRGRPSYPLFSLEF